MTGKWLTVTPAPHGCDLPLQQPDDGQLGTGDRWQCECAQVWEYTEPLTFTSVFIPYPGWRKIDPVAVLPPNVAPPPISPWREPWRYPYTPGPHQTIPMPPYTVTYSSTPESPQSLW